MTRRTHLLIRSLSLLVAFALVGAACTTSDDDASPDDPTGSSTTGTDPGDIATLPLPDFELVARLQPLDSCDALLEHLQTTAASAVSAYGFGTNGGGPFFGPMPVDEMMIEDGDFAAEESTRAATSAPALGQSEGEAGADTGGGDDFSGTNIQEAGVDEPDVVKTDGERIVTVVDGTLRVFDVEDRSLVGSVGLPGWSHQLFLTGERAWVIAGGGGMIVDTLPAEDSEFYPGGDTTTIIEVDLSDPASPTVDNEVEVEGSFLNARLVGDTAHVVVRSQPLGFSFVQPTGPDSVDAAIEANQKILANSSLEQWLPRAATRSDSGDPTERDLIDCSRVLAPSQFSGFGMLNVIDVNVDSPLATTTTSVLGDGSTVYASTDGLYIAGTRWVGPVPFEEAAEDGETQSRLDQLSEQYSTDLHKFDISDGSTSYVASGQVLGSPLNQFAMSESDGVLRIATTAGAPWSDGADQSESFLTTFRVDGDQLVQVGQVGDMGRGETIRSVRYVGDTAYVVTFEQTDPFYTVDLSDPANPEVMGELKILGYSGYLHPVGDDLILGVGQDATEDGATTGAKVTLFDVSDPANPVDVANWTDDGATADVEWDHRAFLYWEPESLALLPLSDWQSGFFGAVGFDIGAGSISERGRITNGQGGEPNDGSCTQITEELLRDTGNEELIGLIQGAYVRVCGPNDQPGDVGGYSCEQIPIEQIGEVPLDLAAEIDWEDIAPPGSTIDLCYPNEGGDQIVRSLVIGDEVWTLSQGGLGSSAIETLAPTGWIPLAG
jgi:hypothetical protein